jgi:hypothetical protein
MTNIDNPLAAFIEAACVPRDAWHGSGTLERTEASIREKGLNQRESEEINWERSHCGREWEPTRSASE